MPTITKQSKYQKIITSVGMIAFFAIAILATEQQVQAEKSPLYDHGCSDARKDPDNRYINEDGKGPDNHTNEFMDGYNSGYNSCSGSGGNDDLSNNNENSQSQSQSSSNRSENEVNTLVPGASCYFS